MKPEKVTKNNNNNNNSINNKHGDDNDDDLTIFSFLNKNLTLTCKVKLPESRISVRCWNTKIPVCPIFSSLTPPFSQHNQAPCVQPRSQDPLSSFLKEGRVDSSYSRESHAWGHITQVKVIGHFKNSNELTSNRKNQWQVAWKKTFVISPSLEIHLRKASIVLCLSLVPKWGWERALKPSFY